MSQWMGVQQVANYVGVSKETVYRYLEKGTIPAHRVGKLWKFNTTEIDQWISGAPKAPRVKTTSATTKPKTIVRKKAKTK